MTDNKIKEIWCRQLAWDYSCKPEDIKSRKPYLAKKAYHPNRRIFRGDDCFLKVLIVNGKLAVNADSEAFLQDNREFFEKASADWFFEPGSLKELDKRLAPLGHTITDYHHFYLPRIEYVTIGAAQSISISKEEAVYRGEGSLHWYEKEEIESFRGDSRFPEALCFTIESPDMLAVTWEENGEIFGMAGASADSEEMWQIGINVLPDGEHRGMGTFLVTNLKDEILRRGKVPFYGTAESHIRSQRVAVGSGFMPAWAELYTRRI